MLILDELRAEGAVDWIPIGVRGAARERALEAWIVYLVTRRGMAGAAPLELFRAAEREVRQNGSRLPPVRLEAALEEPATRAAVRRAYEAARDSVVEIDVPAVGRVTLAVAKAIGGVLTMQFLSGFRTYIGAAVLMLTGAAAVLNGLACILQGASDGSFSVVSECWQALLLGTGTFGAGMAALGLGGKADKDAAVQIALAEGNVTTAKAVAAGAVSPSVVAK